MDEVIEQYLGIVAMDPKQEYNASTKYDKLNIVTYEGSSYCALKDTQGNLPTDETFWQLVAQKGDTYEITEQDIKDLEDKITGDANSEFNKNYDEKLKSFNDNATSKTNSFDTNASDSLSAYNSNVTSKINDFNSNATSKMTAFNNNATQKTTDFDNNYTEKLSLFNTNADTKTTDFNDNAEEKIQEYNDNVIDFENILDTTTPKQILKGNSIYIDDALALPIFESKVEGRSYQNTTTGKNKIGFANLEEKNIQGITFSITDNVISLSGQNIQTYAAHIVSSLNVDLSVETDTNCTLSYKVLNGQKDVKFGISFRDENNTQLDYIQDNNATDLSTTKIISSNSINNTHHFNFFVRTQEVLSDLKIIVQLEFNAEATEIENYTGGQPSPSIKYSQEIKNIADVTLEIRQDSQIKSYPISLNNNFISKIWDIADELFIDKKGNISINKYIFKKIFDGTENWFKSGLSTSSIFVAALEITSLNINFSYRTYFLSSHFRYSANTIQKNTFRIYEGDTNKYYIAFCFDINEISTLLDAKTWIANNQLELEFISNESQIVNLGKLEESIKTFDCVNNIQLLANLDTEIEVKYALDIKKYIDKQNNLQDTQIDEINTLLGSTDTSAMLLDNYQNDLESEV